MSDLPTLIAGGGIAGLAAALALSKRGESCVVLEREAVFSETGAGLQLGPNAIGALKTLGVWDEVSKITGQPTAIELRDARSGQLVKRIPLDQSFEHAFGEPYRVALRADLHRALLTCCKRSPRIRLTTGFEVKEILLGHDDDVTLVSAHGASERGGSVIGADGIHSIVRHLVFGTPGAKATGESHHRALLSAIPSIAGLDLQAVTVWMGSGFHIVHYPVGHPQKLNLVFALPARRSMDDVNLKLAASLQSLLVHAKAWSTWPASYIEPLRHWTQDNVLLIGDAAHGTVPYMAQGAAMALEDAAALMQFGAGDFPVSQRMRRTRKLHRVSLAQGHIYHLPQPLALARNLTLKFLPDSLFLMRLKWLYGQNR